MEEISALNLNLSTIEALKNGDLSAFDLIYWKLNSRIYNFAVSILHDKSLAEDITQTVFLTIWEQRENIALDKNFISYIYTIARNCVYRETEKCVLRDKYIEIQLAEESKVDMRISAEEKIDAEIFKKHVEYLTSLLPESRKEIFLMSRKDGLSNKAISKQLGISVRTVETQIYRSLEYFKKALKL